MKKVLSLILVAIMLLSCLAGCGGTGGAASGDEEDPLASRGLGAAAVGIPEGIMLTQVVADLIPEIVSETDKYLDGEYTDEEFLDVLKHFRGDYDYSMAQTHDVEVKKHLDKINKLVKDIIEEKEAAAEGTEEEVVEETTEEVAEGEEGAEEEVVEEEEPSLLEQVLERRNAIAAILEIEQRDAI